MWTKATSGRRYREKRDFRDCSVYGRTNSSMDQVLMTGTAERRRRYRAIDKPLRGSVAKMNRVVICERITLNLQRSRERDAVIVITISLPIRLYPLKLILATILIAAVRFEETYVIDGDLATHATNSRAPFERTYLSLQISQFVHLAK